MGNGDIFINKKINKMPIQLNYTDQNSGLNLTTSYWFIVDATFDFLAGKVQFDVSGYVTLALKTAGKKPFMNRSFVVDLVTLGLTGNSTFAQAATAAYTYALANDGFFSGGTIV